MAKDKAAKTEKQKPEKQKKSGPTEAELKARARKKNKRCLRSCGYTIEQVQQMAKKGGFERGPKGLTEAGLLEKKRQEEHLRSNEPRFAARKALRKAKAQDRREKNRPTYELLRKKQFEIRERRRAQEATRIAKMLEEEKKDAQAVQEGEALAKRHAQAS